MLNYISNFFLKKNQYKIQSFTFFIPAPPLRSTGYREKQFDQIFYNLINKGYKILDFQMQSTNTEKSPGVWLVFILQATNKSSDKLDLDEIYNETIQEQASVKNSIEGFYYIEENENKND